MREMLTHNATLAMAGFLLARCAGPEKYFTVTDAIFHARDDMEQNNTYRDGLLKIAKSVGMNEAQFDACTTDPKAIEAIKARVDKYMSVDGISGTPTFVINGKQMTQSLPTIADFDKAIAAARAAPAPAPAAAAPTAPATPATPAPAPKT
jgi:protein-disulfide isomerase